MKGEIASDSEMKVEFQRRHSELKDNQEMERKARELESLKNMTKTKDEIYRGNEKN
jgi:hypothetical protein